MSPTSPGEPPDPAPAPSVEPPPAGDPGLAPSPAGPTEQTAPDLHPGEKRLLVTVAVIAALAALLGTGVGGGATLLAARTQAVAQSETEAAKYIRDERTKFYTQVLEKIEGLQRFESKVDVAKSDGESELLGTLETSTRYSEAVRELSGLTSRSMLLSSIKTQSVLHAMVQARLDVAAEVTTLVGAVILARKFRQELQGVALQTLDMKTAADQYKAKRDKLFAVDVDVVMAMRAELGFPLP